MMVNIHTFRQTMVDILMTWLCVIAFLTNRCFVTLLSARFNNHITNKIVLKHYVIVERQGIFLVNMLHLNVPSCGRVALLINVILSELKRTVCASYSYNGNID